MAHRICGEFSKEKSIGTDEGQDMPLCPVHRKMEVEEGKRLGFIPVLVKIANNAQPIDRMCQYPIAGQGKVPVKKKSKKKKK